MLRYVPLAVVLTVALASVWIVHSLEADVGGRAEAPAHVPDFYMKQFATTTMDANGLPLRRLEAEYMAHFPDSETHEFSRPYLVMYGKGGAPWHVKSERGWLSADGDVMLLLGPVDIWRNSKAGPRRLTIETEDLRVLPDAEYGETDKPVVITTPHARSSGVGMRAHLDESRVELLSQVRTVYERDGFVP